MRPLFDRALEPAVRTSLRAMRVVLLTGPRQCGKSTLARMLDHGRYVTLDDENERAAAKRDPAGFLDAIGTPATIDEVQRVPELLLAIKAAVDRDNTPGRYLLTGSADVLSLPANADTLVGRVAIHQLAPLTQAEIEHRAPEFLKRLCTGRSPRNLNEAPDFTDLAQRVLRGGFPEAVTAPDDDARTVWFRSWASTIVTRELPSIADIEHRSALPRFLRLLAARSPGQLNVSALARDAAIPRSTLDRYLALLDLTYVVRLSTPWFSSRTTREVKQPRSLFVDCGVAAHLRSARLTQLTGTDRTLLGTLTEQLVSSDLAAMTAWTPDVLGLHHWRTSRGHEVDFVVEHDDLTITAIEVKVARSVHPSDARHLRALRTAAGDRFRRGIVLYMGTLVHQLEPGIEAWPLPAMWAADDL